MEAHTQSKDFDFDLLCDLGGVFISLLHLFPRLLKKDLRLNQRFPNVHEMATLKSSGGLVKTIEAIPRVFDLLSLG